MLYYNYKMKGDETMKLELNASRREDWARKYFVKWTKSEFGSLLHYTQKSTKIKKDGHFYKRDMENLNYYIDNLYRALIGRFDVDEDMMRDERDTVLRMLKTLPAEQFRAFAEITFEPYVNLEEVDYET